MTKRAAKPEPQTRAPSGLTWRQDMFVNAYARNANGEEAAKLAGYAPKNARITASKLLSQANIREAIQSAMREIQAAEQTVTRITKAMLVSWTADAVMRAKAKGATAAELRGIELLARMHGFIIERKDVRQVRSWEDLSEDELRALANEPAPEISHEGKDDE